MSCCSLDPGVPSVDNLFFLTVKCFCCVGHCITRVFKWDNTQHNIVKLENFAKTGDKIKCHRTSPGWDWLVEVSGTPHSLDCRGWWWLVTYFDLENLPLLHGRISKIRQGSIRAIEKVLIQLKGLSRRFAHNAHINFSWLFTSLRQVSVSQRSWQLERSEWDLILGQLVVLIEIVMCDVLHSSQDCMDISDLVDLDDIWHVIAFWLNQHSDWPLAGQ